MDPQNTINRAIDHLRANRLPQAEESFRDALSQNPRHPDALHLLGCTLSRMSRPAEAIDLINQAIAIDPAQPIFHNNLGLALLVLGKKDQAITAFQNAIALNPNLPDAHNHLGNTLSDLKKFDEAITHFNRAIILKPNHAPYHFNLGNCLLHIPPSANRTDHLQKAVACFEQALSLNPDIANAANNLGNALQQLGRTNEAIAAWQRATRLAPHALSLYNLGRAYYEQDRLDDAQAAIENALRLQPDQPDTLNNLGNVLRQSAQCDQSIAAFDRAIAIDKNCAKAQSNRLYTLYYHPGIDARQLHQAHQIWNAEIARPLRSNVPHENDRSPTRRLKIGYVSPNFSEHCQSLFTAPLFSNHDHNNFQIHLYSDVKTPDSLTDQLRANSDIWRDITAMTDDQAAAQIRDDKIDILIDLTLHMAENRALLFARKPAPIQLTWLGYPGTTGLEAIDYRLTDPHLDPPNQTDAQFTEKSIRLPHTFWCIDPFRGRPEDLPAINPLPAQKNGHITFGCLNNFCKLNNPLLELWAQVLDAIPNSRLILLAPPGSPRQWITQSLGHRVDFVSRQNRRDYLAIYHRIDLGLDTVPYNGHTTSLDSFWMGVPVITLAGKTVVGRAGLSQLTNLNLPELAATTPDEFTNIARALATDLPRLAHLRRTLRDRMQSSPLMDAPRFAKDFESTLRQIWQSWCK